MAKKEKTRRSNTKYAGLKPHLNLRTRYELVDYDYIDKLSDEEKDWLNRFTEEYTHANYNHDGQIVQKKKKDELDSYNRNNYRNRDILTRVKATGRIRSLDYLRYAGEAPSPEDEMIQREELLEIVNNPEVMKMAETDPKIKKIIKEVKERIKERESMFSEELDDPQSNTNKGNKKS